MSVTTMKTPGVYIQELDAFGNAVVPVPTAIPAFIGYTGQTSYNGKNLVNKAVKVGSLAEYCAIFGSEPPPIQFSLKTAVSEDPATDSDAAATDAATTDAATTDAATTDAATTDATTTDAATTDATTTDAEGAGGDSKVEVVPDFIINDKGYSLGITTVNYRLHSAINFFYLNGGGTCYIVSTGGYSNTGSLTTTKPFEDALTLLVKEAEPTMIVIPDAVELMDSSKPKFQDKYALCYSLQGLMINHCGSLATRVALLDIPGGYSEILGEETSVEGFRNAVEPTLPKSNSYAAAYYPWLHTTVNQLENITYKNVASGSQSVVTGILNAEFPPIKDPKGGENPVDNPMKKYITALFPSSKTGAGNAGVGDAGATASVSISPEKADSVLKNLSTSYKMLLNHCLDKLNLMPPSAAMAGIYTTVDNSEGVWVAPANVGVQGVVAPSIKIDLKTQEDLNVPLDGKSVCAIRSFPGKGVLVWGARTLDGNSNDWRYINVRRTLIYIEQSVKEAASAYVFAPNDASTWVSVKSMVSNFLLGIWNQGGLVGPKPADAFSVTVGLGSTMTSDDILQGRMIVAVKVALSHPAEFIEITFQQEMQKG